MNEYNADYLVNNLNIVYVLLSFVVYAKLL